MKVMGLKGVGQHTPKIRVLNSQQELTRWHFGILGLGSVLSIRHCSLRRYEGTYEGTNNEGTKVFNWYLYTKVDNLDMHVRTKVFYILAKISINNNVLSYS